MNFSMGSQSHSHSDLCQAVVKACVDASTHYVDVTGEVAWMQLAVGLVHFRDQEDYCQT